MTRTCLASALALAAAAVSAAPVTIDFENIAGANSVTSYDNSGFTRQSFQFTLDHGHVIDSAYYSGYLSNNGTDWLMHDSTGSMQIMRAGGNTFALSQFRGQQRDADGLLCRQLDDHADPQLHQHPQTLQLSSAWSNLTRVQFVGNANQAYDNFVFNREAAANVPELALVGLALGGVAFARRRG